MLVKEIKEIAKARKVPVGKKKKTELIRAIQEAEGNAPCFDSGIENCGLADCLWFDDCQK